MGHHQCCAGLTEACAASLDDVSSVECDSDLLVVVDEAVLAVFVSKPTVKTTKCLQRVRQKSIPYSRH